MPYKHFWAIRREQVDCRTESEEEQSRRMPGKPRKGIPDEFPDEFPNEFQKHIKIFRTFAPAISQGRVEFPTGGQSPRLPGDGD